MGLFVAASHIHIHHILASGQDQSAANQINWLKVTPILAVVTYNHDAGMNHRSLNLGKVR